jgi:DNA-directed RNA polymerase beta subunit
MQQIIPRDVSIAYDDGDLLIRSDTGRVLRPVYRNFEGLADCLSGRTWDSLVHDSTIVYIDPSEAESSNISMTVTGDLRYDYCEIEPNLMFGISAGVIPFPNHSQGPRNIYQACMAKQAINMTCLSYMYRFDTTSHVSYYQQKRLVTTKINDMCGLDVMTGGLNCNIAVMTYTGSTVGPLSYGNIYKHEFVALQ